MFNLKPLAAATMLLAVTGGVQNTPKGQLGQTPTLEAQAERVLPPMVQTFSENFQNRGEIIPTVRVDETSAPLAGFSKDITFSTRYALMQTMVTYARPLANHTTQLPLQKQLEVLVELMKSNCVSADVRAESERAEKLLADTMAEPEMANLEDDEERHVVLMGRLNQGVGTVEEMNVHDGIMFNCTRGHIAVMASRYNQAPQVVANPELPESFIGADMTPVLEGIPEAVTKAAEDEPQERKPVRATKQKDTPIQCLGLQTVLCQGGLSKAPQTQPEEQKVLSWGMTEVTQEQTR